MLAVDSEGLVGVLVHEQFGAAHSMDTDWYAVDNRGEVARCFSNEQAPYPRNGFLDYDFDAIRSLAVAHITAGRPPSPWASAEVLSRALVNVSDPAERALVQAIVDGDDASREIYRDWLQVHRPTPPALYRVERNVVPIRVEDLPEKWNGVIQFVTPQGAKSFVETFGSMMSECEVLEAKYGWPDAIAGIEMDNWMVAGELSALEIVGVYELAVDRENCGLIGLYSYDADWAGPYHRIQVPREPLTIDQVPEPLRSEILRCRLPLSFRETETFSPDEYVSCDSYGNR